jgi:hypothetical protein
MADGVYSTIEYGTNPAWPCRIGVFYVVAGITLGAHQKSTPSRKNPNDVDVHVNMHRA